MLKSVAGIFYGRCYLQPPPFKPASFLLIPPKNRPVGNADCLREKTLDQAGGYYKYDIHNLHSYFFNRSLTISQTLAKN